MSEAERQIGVGEPVSDIELAPGEELEILPVEIDDQAAEEQAVAESRIIDDMFLRSLRRPFS